MLSADGGYDCAALPVDVWRCQPEKLLTAFPVLVVHEISVESATSSPAMVANSPEGRFLFCTTRAANGRRIPK
ncbi:MAG: hypothetical protein ACREIH_04545 [Nitrospiraceae bacterium]